MQSYELTLFFGIAVTELFKDNKFAFIFNMSVCFEQFLITFKTVPA